MLISIMSDSHDYFENLEKAINISNERGCEYLLFAGDLIAPPGVAFLSQFNGKVLYILGNNEAELIGLFSKMSETDNVEFSKDPDGGYMYEGEIDGIKIFMHHYPKIAEIALDSGNYDLCVHGHTHEYRHEKKGEAQLVNPGALHPLKCKPSFVIFDTKSKEIEKIEL